MEKIVSLCKRRGFVFQSSEIYGGINGFWDYGPLGAELKRNLRDTWWRAMTRDREDVVGLDTRRLRHTGNEGDPIVSLYTTEGLEAPHSPYDTVHHTRVLDPPDAGKEGHGYDL